METKQLIKTIIYIIGFLVFGAGNSVLSKILMSSTSPNFYGVEKKFEKPWFQNWAMFFGMMTVFVPESIRKLLDARKKKGYVKLDEASPLLGDDFQDLGEGQMMARPQRDWTWLKIVVPSVCDAVATLMMNAALVVIPVSIWQMLRGSIIIFTAILTVFYRKRKLFPQQWLGIVLVFAALALLGATAMLKGSGSDEISGGRLAIGVVLVVSAQAIQALQTVIEEQMMHDSTTPPMAIVAWEGFWGCMMCTFMFMPIAYFINTTPGDGLDEDLIDTFVMMMNRPILILFSISFMLSILLFNIFGMFIMEVTSALTRNVLEPLRTILVWVTSLAIFYASPEETRADSGGEEWVSWTWMQLGGFAVMTIGVMTYNFVWRFPCWPGPPTEKDKVVDEGDIGNDE